MKEQCVTENIAAYIKNSELAVSQISKDVGISVSKLLYENKENLSASEFLVLCQYLDVNPKQFQ